jgi:ABC-type lipoprotein export system ATPase subunit
MARWSSLTERPVIEAIEVTRVHAGNGAPVLALDSVSVGVARGEVLAVVGPSGSGKSTLLFLLAGLDRPDGGKITVAGTDWGTLDRSERARFRRRTCGFVAQGMALLPQATAAENVELPLLLDGVEPTVRTERVAEALERVDLAAEARKLPDQLSGGQQQRVAIARALVTEPAVVLADEPTGNLDSATGQAIVRLLLAAAVEHGAGVVLVTHDPAISAHADRVLALRSGRIASEHRRVA